MGAVTVPANPLTRAVAFLDRYIAAPADADVELSVGRTEGGAPAIAVHLNGELHAFTTVEARKLADVFEDSLRRFPGTPETVGFDNIIVMLRAVADKADMAANPGSPHA